MPTPARSREFAAAARALRWYAVLPLLPLLWLQGIYVRARTPRLPVASGKPQGVVPGPGPALSLLVLGESPVAGVGVSQYAESLSAHLAAHLARLTGRGVHWTALGENGIDAAGVLRTLLPSVTASRPDAAVVALGVNDTTGLTPRARWRRALRRLIAGLRPIVQGPIVFAPVPPMHSFTGLPQPLRSVLGLRAWLLNHDIATVAREAAGVAHAPWLPSLGPEYLAADGYHPSAAGCAAWGAALAELVHAQLSSIPYITTAGEKGPE